MTGTAIIVSSEPCNINTGYGIIRHTPPGRFGPVATIYQSGSGFNQRQGLLLGQPGRYRAGTNPACSITVVVSYPVDTYRVGAGVRADLETNGFAFVYTHIC